MGARLWVVNHFDEVTDLAVSPAPPSGFPITNLQSRNRDETWRSPNLEQQVITGSFGGNGRYISAWGGWPLGELLGSCMIGATIRVEFWTSADRSGSAIYDSGPLDWFTFTNPLWATFPWGAGPWSMESGDYLARLAPIARHFPRVAVGSFRITIANGGAVDTPFFEMRRFWLAEYIDAPYKPAQGMAPQWISGSQLQRTVGGTLLALRRWVRRALKCEIRLTSEAHRAAWAAACHLAQPAAEIVFSPFDHTDGARRFRDHLVLGSMEVLNPEVWDNYELWKLQLAFLEG